MLVALAAGAATQLWPDRNLPYLVFWVSIAALCVLWLWKLYDRWKTRAATEKQTVQPRSEDERPTQPEIKVQFKRYDKELLRSLRSSLFDVRARITGARISGNYEDEAIRVIEATGPFLGNPDIVLPLQELSKTIHQLKPTKDKQQRGAYLKQVESVQIQIDGLLEGTRHAAES